MINLIKYWIAKWLQSRMVFNANCITEAQAIKWNHLEALKISRGKVRWDWNRIKGKKPVIAASKGR